LLVLKLAETFEFEFFKHKFKFDCEIIKTNTEIQ